MAAPLAREPLTARFLVERSRHPQRRGDSRSHGSGLQRRERGRHPCGRGGGERGRCAAAFTSPVRPRSALALPTVRAAKTTRRARPTRTDAASSHPRRSCARPSETPWTILRPCAVYGPRDRGFLPAVPAGHTRPHAARRTARHRFTFVFVDDLVQGCRARRNRRPRRGRDVLRRTSRAADDRRAHACGRRSVGRQYRPRHVAPVLVDALASAGDMHVEIRTATRDRQRPPRRAPGAGIRLLGRSHPRRARFRRDDVRCATASNGRRAGIASIAGRDLRAVPRRPGEFDLRLLARSPEFLFGSRVFVAMTAANDSRTERRCSSSSSEPAGIVGRSGALARQRRGVAFREWRLPEHAAAQAVVRPHAVPQERVPRGLGRHRVVRPPVSRGHVLGPEDLQHLDISAHQARAGHVRHARDGERERVLLPVRRIVLEQDPPLGVVARVVARAGQRREDRRVQAVQVRFRPRTAGCRTTIVSMFCVSIPRMNEPTTPMPWRRMRATFSR